MSPLGWPLEGQSLISGEANSLPKSPGQFFQSEGSSLYGQKSSPSGSLHRSFPKGLQTKVISISSHLSYTLQTVRPPLTRYFAALPLTGHALTSAVHQMARGLFIAFPFPSQ